MDSGLGSDDEKRNRTKAQKQLQNEQKQLFSGCFIDATSLGDEGEFEQHRQNDERRQGALIFRSSIPQYSMLQMSHSATESDQGSVSDHQDDKAGARSIEITTPHNSIVQLEAEVERKTPVGFYVDLGEVEVVEAQPTAPVEKKNIFSMVIDFNVPKREMPTRLSTSLYGGRKKQGMRSTLSSSSSHTSEEVRGSCENVSERESRSENQNNKMHENQSDSAASLQSNCETVETDTECNSLPVAIDLDDNSKDDLKNEEENAKIISGSNADEVNEDIVNKDIPKSTKQFVKLSDLEEQSPRLDLFLAPRMSRSIPEKSWVESPLATFRSASYRSSPQPFQSDMNDPPEPGSMMESSSTLPPKRSAQRLGTDLLRMFLEEIGPDVTLDINGRRLRAHKCILSSRCQYFAAVFGGKSSEDVVSIQGYSYAAVHFALCHIYSGAAHIPQSISLVELAALSDMLGLEGLKEVVAHALKVRHCHNFHDPCSGCITGVTEVLPLAAAYGLDELYQACLHWITKQFFEVWPNRAFSSLPRELRDKCYQQHVVHMSPDSVLDTIVSTDKLLAAMPTAKWAESVAQLTLQLADHCQIYLRQNYAAILASPNFSALDIRTDILSQLEDSLISAAGALKLDQACRSYINCHKMLQKHWSIPFIDILRKIYSQIESCVVRQAAQASRHSLWMQLEPSLRKRIRDLSAALTRTKPEPVNPPSSSSDSSRNSSPAIKNAHRTQLHSPSLRRSLLMAARSSQTSTSPSMCRRTSTLTNPTQSSAAKSTSKNISSQKTMSNRSTTVTNKPANTQKITTKRENTISGSTSTNTSTYGVLQKERFKKPMVSNGNANVTSKKVDNIHNQPRKTISTNLTTSLRINKKSTNIPSKVSPGYSDRISSPVKQASSPLKQASSPLKQASSPQKQLSPRKQSSSPHKQATSPYKQSPRVCRSSTFLKEEPTVLKKM